MVTDRVGPTITTLKAEVDYLDGEVKKLLNLLADARTESMKLRARITELEGQHKGLVLNNAILRERPDLPLNRIPAARAMTKLYEDNERLRAALDSTDAAKTLWENKAKQHLSRIEHLEAALRLFACDCIESSNLCPSPQNCRNYIARAALEGK